MKYYNNGLAARQLAILELLDDDILILSNIDGVGPIDLVTLNIKTKEIEFIDCKADHPRKHRKRPYSDLQKQLNVKHLYINLRKGTKRIDRKKSDLKYEPRFNKNKD